MPLATISVGDVETIAKLNLTISKVNVLDAGLANEVAARALGDVQVLEQVYANFVDLQTKINLEETARIDDDNAEEAARVSGDTLRPTFAAASGTGLFLARAKAGSPSALTAIPLSGFLSTSTGSAVPMPAAGVVSGLDAKRIEPGRKYRARFVVKRTTDSGDPINDAVRLGIAWLSSTYTVVSESVLIDIPLLVADGRVEYSFNIATTAADDVDFITPNTAIYARAFVQTYGTGVTNLEVLEIKDLTDGVDYSPDVSSYRNEIAALMARIEVLEDLVGA